MSICRVFRISGVVAVLLLLSSGISQGAISLRVDGADVTSITLSVGQSCYIEIYSTNNAEYIAYVGFQAADALGTFDYQYTNPQAGTFAMVNPYNEPPFSLAYEAVAMGDPSQGVHFVFLYTASTPGPVELGLWNIAINKVDAVSITVQGTQGTGACCDQGTGYCYMSEEEDCPYSWLGEGSDCAMCIPPEQPGACCDEMTGGCYISLSWDCPYHWLGPWSDCGLCHGQEPTQGACCNQDTGECDMREEWDCIYNWLGLGTDCSSCVPSVEVKRFEINQCFQEVEADGVTQKYDLIETKPFVARAILKATTPGAKSVNVKLKVENIGEKEPEWLGRSANPIKIAPKTDPKIDPCATCDFFFLYTDTQNMKAGTYKFSLVVKDSGAEIWSHTYTFKSSKTFKILVVPRFTFIRNNTWWSGYWSDSYINFLEQVYPVPYRDAKNVNHLEIEKGVPLFGGSQPSTRDLFRILNKHLDVWNSNKKPGDAPADRICAVVPSGTAVLGTALGMAWKKAAIITADTNARYILGHEIGHTHPVWDVYMGEEYVASDRQLPDGRLVLQQWLRFNLNPPPLSFNPPGPFKFIIEAVYPDGGKLCKWDPDQSSYAPRQEIVGICCDGRFVVPDKAGYDLTMTNKREVRFFPSRPADNTLTMMSTISGSNWISGKEYKSLITLLAPPAPAPLPETATAPPPSGQRMLVSGIIDIDEQTAEISPLVPVSNLELSEEVTDPNYRLVFKSQTGEVLDTFNFASLAGENPDSMLKRLFSVVVDLPDNTARIQVTIEGELADELQLTDNSPTVTVLSPNGGEEITGEMAITWSASDADINDANNLRYTVEFSHDNGTEWSALVIDHNDDEFTVDSNYLPGGPDCLVKVIASDGWNRSEDTSNAPFTIPTKPPQVTILDPEDGAILLNAESVQGRCTAYDLETGDVNDPNAIVWSSNIDGLLGKGNLVGFALSVGEHILSATATDPEAKTGIDTVSVKVLANASDFNCDLRVSFLDLAKFAENWQASCSPPNWCEGTDIDRSGIVDYDDLAELVENWLWQAQP
jgi:hypothetical protein